MRKNIFAFYLVLLTQLTFSQSKLFKAIQDGDSMFVSEYISNGKDLNVLYKATTIDGYSQKKITYNFEILEYAASHGEENIVKLLLKNKDRFSSYQASLNKAFTASIAKGNIKVIKLLHEAGADINAVCEVCYRQAAIQTALEYGYYEIYSYLIQNDANTDVRNSFGRTLLHSVAHTGKIEIAKQLIEKKLDIDAFDTDGATPLIYAASNGDFEMFKLFLENGANIAIRENDGTDVLMNAVTKGNLEIINFLLNKNSDINSMNNDKDSPLIFAAAEKQPIVVKLLISKGADINHANSKGETALLWAIWNNDIEIAKLLVENGADLTYMNYLKSSKKYIKDQAFNKYLEEKIKGIKKPN